MVSTRVSGSFHYKEYIIVQFHLILLLHAGKFLWFMILFGYVWIIKVRWHVWKGYRVMAAFEETTWNTEMGTTVFLYYHGKGA